ncbi:hypothetical protein HMI54_010414 [Coelomomyces lativittatus]|nr:hypothetical protein HMI55_003699 [Coelomomyces lativittatus]KAJ1500902.1 hypothetical protein HMI54_010414 [Coelomomyces lativittatus]KAJ1505872.1 hypothetical protein HMI56_000897 [Coelomomyces lativittatus]
MIYQIMAYKRLVLVLLLWIQSLLINAQYHRRSSNQIEEPVLSALDITSKISTEDVEKHNSRVLAMTQKLLHKWKTDVYFFSPIGLYSMLGTLSLMVKTGTTSNYDLDTTLQLNGQSLTPSLMYLWNQHWIKQSDFQLINVFIWPKYLSSIQGTKLESKLKESNTAILDSPKALTTFAGKVIYGPILKPYIEENLMTPGLVNIMMYHFTWLQAPEITNPRKYTYQYKKKRRVKKIRYMKHSFHTQCSDNESYKACILPLAKSQKTPAAPLVAYIVSMKSTQENLKIQNMWSTIYTEMNKAEKLMADIYLPGIDLEYKRKYTEKNFKELLKENNQDFISSHKETLTLTQIYKFCMDKKSLSVIEGVEEQFHQGTCSSQKMEFDQPFYIVLVDPKTDVIAFMTKVKEGLDAEYPFCNEG